MVIQYVKGLKVWKTKWAETISWMEKNETKRPL
jgi:hypothetical protein